MEDAVEDLRRAEDVSELWTTFHPEDFRVSDETIDDIPTSGEYVLRQGPRSGIRDHGVSEVRNRRHHLDLVLRSRRPKPDATVPGRGNLPRRYLKENLLAQTLPETRRNHTERNFSISAGMQSPVGSPNGDKVASQP